MNKIKESLKSLTIASLKKGEGPFVTLAPTDSISSALKTLATNEITSAPIFDQESKTFLGFVDVLDLAVFIARVYNENSQKHPHLYDPKELTQYFLRPVSEVLNASQRDPFLPVDSSWTLDTLVTYFLKWGIHRVPVITHNTISGVISQSDVIQYLDEQVQNMPDVTATPINQLGLAVSDVISVLNSDTLMKAFLTILSFNITGVAIVDQNGALVSNISASDLKGVTEATFYKLEAPIHQILLNHATKLPPVSCKPDATLGTLLSLFAKTGVHRVFVTNDQNQPTAVITLTTLLKAISLRTQENFLPSKKVTVRKKFF